MYNLSCELRMRRGDPDVELQALLPYELCGSLAQVQQAMPDVSGERRRCHCQNTNIDCALGGSSAGTSPRATQPVLTTDVSTDGPGEFRRYTVIKVDIRHFYCNKSVIWGWHEIWNDWRRVCARRERIKDIIIYKLNNVYFYFLLPDKE